MHAPLSLLLAALPLLVPAGDVRTALRRLDAPSAVERQAAERWLAAHLAPGDLALVAEAAVTAGPEARRRLAGALGADERHFELTALLLADSQASARELGEDVLLRLVTRWLGEGGIEPVASLRVLAAGVLGSEREYRWSPRAGRFEEVVEGILRATAEHGRGEPGVEGLAVVVDPKLHGASFPDPVDEDGGALAVDFEPANLVFHAASVQGATVEAYGLDGAGTGGAWLHLAPSARGPRQRADALIARWVRDLLEPREPARRTAAARALSGTGWGAALNWLDLRWRRDGDASAMEGVLLAASRGRVLPSLLSVERVGTLLGEADAALAAPRAVGGPRARLVMHALAALPPRGIDGADLAARVAEGFDGLGASARHLRVAVLAGMGRAPASWRDGLRQRLASSDGDARAAYLFECVRALAATRDPRAEEAPTVLADFRSVFEHALARSAGTLLVERLVAARLRPPPDLRDPGDVPAGWGGWERALLAEAWQRAGEDVEAATEHWRALVERGVGDDEGRVGARLRELGESRARLARGVVLAAASGARVEAGAPPGPATRLCVLAGAWPPERQVELLERLSADGPVAPGDLALLGPLAAGPAGDEALRLLLEAVRLQLADEALEEHLDDPWVASFERAWRELVAAERDTEAARFLRRLSPRLRRSDHPLRTEVQRRRWPRLPAQVPFPLEALEVRLGGG